MSRIIRTKFLYRAAVTELDSGHPFAEGMAISLLQDAVEAMAHEAAASVNVPLPARSYMAFGGIMYGQKLTVAA